MINLTPHEVTVVDAEGKTLAVFPPSGTVARVEMTRSEPTSLPVAGAEIPVWATTRGAVTGLPAEASPDLYIVSRLVYDSQPGRVDLLVPDNLVRDENGRIRGCRGFESRLALREEIG